ncbi:MAG: glycoside hydrolase family 2 TIM barrel-domain containing protein [Lentisphaerota bacterium]
MRVISSVNDLWKYSPDFKENYLKVGAKHDGFKDIVIPHANTELPFNYFDEKDFQFISTYKRYLFIPKETENMLTYLHFEGVMTFAKVYLNGMLLGEHKGGYTEFDVLLNKAAKFGEHNELVVVVDSTERKDIPPFGGQIDYLTYGGIYREVQVKFLPQIHISNIFCKTYDVLNSEKRLDVEVFIHAEGKIKEGVEIKVKVTKGRKTISKSSELVKLSNLENKVIVSFSGLKDIKLWDIDSPELYTVEVELTGHDTDSRKIGFRTAEFKPDGFYLNGRKLKIFGLNRHQSYPYMGYAMPARCQKKDADILKYELSLNTVRTSHYPQSRHFLDRCDEIGLLVFEEIPGWQHIGDKDWKKVAVQNVKDMIERDWNRPSIIIWGVRINESLDDHDFYAETNKVAHELDPTRQTGGVRYLNNSELLEDVYTINDFVLNGGSVALRGQKEVTGQDRFVPYLITEYNGHMYPTKKQDLEERQIEHCIRHLRVIDAGRLDKNICGTIGWCAFDYNTHKDFGAGDKVCHHGVMDMFRLPKLASYAYASQIDPEIKPILEPVTVWARGEKNECLVSPLLILTNCDRIDFYYNDKFERTCYPARSLFKGLEYPPIIIDKVESQWGFLWQKAEFRGFKNGKQIISKVFSNSQTPKELIVEADDYELSAKELDATRVKIEIVDEVKNKLFFLNGIVELEIAGPGRIAGPSKLVVQGGEIACWILTSGKKGTIKLKVSYERTPSKEIEIKVK